jgi:hypothetical protein
LVERYPERAKERYLSEDELKSLGKALAECAGIEGFLENRGELKEVAADEDGPIKVFVQLMYRLFGTNPVPCPGRKTLRGSMEWGHCWISTASTPTSWISGSMTGKETARAPGQSHQKVQGSGV